MFFAYFFLVELILRMLCPGGAMAFFSKRIRSLCLLLVFRCL
jgi:hypothetical protein